VSYALGIWLGRWKQPASGAIAIVSPLEKTLERELTAILQQHAGEREAAEILELLGGLQSCFRREFWEFHNVLYRGRPVFWGLGKKDRIAVVSSLAADRTTVREALQWSSAVFPHGWDRRTDDGIQANLAPLADLLFDRELARTIKLRPQVATAR
jgi:hypothetical protein